jgi:type II secretory ATPase GspE/PulE/Tfp pilus assembly ATPase PilB-like protein
MIGELRDAITANITVESALTGHVVLTSMHGSTAVSVLQRLAHLGVDPTMMAQALNLVVVQRLARRLCAQCVREDEVSPALLENLVTRHLIARAQTVRLPRPVGCEACDKSGYKGRVAVVELLVLTDELRFMLQSGAKPPDLLGRAAQTGHFVPTTRSAALLMARKLIAPADALLTVAG